MTTSSPSSPDHDDALQQEIAALTTALHAVDQRLKNTLSIDEVHKRLARAKAEVAVRRRRTFFLVIFLLVLGLQIGDQHTEMCRVGAVNHQILRPLNPKVQFVCDAMNPTHVHTFGETIYPSLGNYAGVAIYTLGFLALALYNAWANKKSFERAEEGFDPDHREPVPPGEKPSASGAG